MAEGLRSRLNPPTVVRQLWRKVSATMRQRGAKVSFFERGHNAPVAWQVKRGNGWLTVVREEAQRCQRSRRKPYDLAPNRNGWLNYVGKERVALTACVPPINKEVP